MGWNPEISQQLLAAFRNSDVEDFKRLLQDNPGYLRDEDGADFWMWKSAMSGKITILKALIELGLNVNESHDRNDESDPFYEPEGPILTAAGFGDVEMVQWLLEQGAKINFVVNGKPRCLPLIRAAGEGHFDVVKLLVQHGADVQSTWQGLNAITQAERLGHIPIRDYLASLLESPSASPTNKPT